MIDPDAVETDEAPDCLKISVAEADSGERMDKFLSSASPDFSRTRLKNLIENGDCQINGILATDASRKIKTGDEIFISLPPLQDAYPEPGNIPLNIVYEDEALIVINKAAGMVVHPAVGNRNGTLVNALLYHCGDSLSGINGIKRPGIVHRLDKDTSGLMIVAKTDAAHQKLSAQLQDKSLSRVYEAFVTGVPLPRKGEVDQPIGRHANNRLKMTVTKKNSKDALTYYKVEKDFSGVAALVECRLSTGRTHQIRVHFEYLKHPLLGDPLYGGQATGLRAALRRAGYEEEEIAKIAAFPRQALHARELSFVHPVSEEMMTFHAERPDDLKNLFASLEK